MTLPRDLTAGTALKATEYLEGHVNCRCTLVPRPRSYADILGDPSLPDNRPPIESGASLFAKLPPSQQLRILGPGKYELYRQGVPLEAFAQRVSSAEWGAARVSKSLADLKRELASAGWRPGDPWAGFDTTKVLAGHTLNNPAIEIAKPAINKVPGEVTSLAEAEEWWAVRFPNTKLQFLNEASLREVNSTFKALDSMAREFPEAWDTLKMVNFRNFAEHDIASWRSNAYAHVTPGMWGNNPNLKFGYYDRIMEFNTEWYGPSRFVKFTEQRLADRMTSYKYYNKLMDEARILLRQHEVALNSYGVELDDLGRMSVKDLEALWHKLNTRDTFAFGNNLAQLYQAKREVERIMEELVRGGQIVERNLGKALFEDSQTGFHVMLDEMQGVSEYSDTLADKLIQSVAVHEFGHVFDNWATSVVNWAIVPKMRSDGWGIGTDVFKALKQALRANTQYAKKNAEERFAELFVEAMMVDKPGSPWARRVRTFFGWLRTTEKYAEHDYAGQGEEAAAALRTAVAMKDALNKLFGFKLFKVESWERSWS